MPRRTPLACALGAVVCSFAVGLRAEDSDPAAAEQLFLAGRAAMQQGSLETACQRFAESQRLDPAAGTLINLADCLERRGLIASSWQRWKEALDDLRKDDDRRAQGGSRMARLEGRLPRPELRLAAGAPATNKGAT